jgi:glycosyltransferase involved in cell wall biosynthesis
MPSSSEVDLDVAVVVTMFQQRAFLADALASIASQRQRPAEVIVIDDGSDEPVDDLVAAVPGVALHRQANQGVAAARNAGLRLTQAPLVVFLDGDDRLLADAITLGTRSLSEHPLAPFTSGASRPITVDGQPLPGIVLPQPRKSERLYEQMLRRPYICPPSTAMFRRQAFDDYGDWLADPDLWGVEDWECYLRLARGAPPACHGGLVTEYRLHSGQSSVQADRMRRSGMLLLERHAELAAGNAARARACRAGKRYVQAQFGWNAARSNLFDDRSVGSVSRAVAAFARNVPSRIGTLMLRRTTSARPAA